MLFSFILERKLTYIQSKWWLSLLILNISSLTISLHSFINCFIVIDDEHIHNWYVNWFDGIGTNTHHTQSINRMMMDDLFSCSTTRPKYVNNFVFVYCICHQNEPKTGSFDKDGPSMISVNILIRSISKISDLDMVSWSWEWYSGYTLMFVYIIIIIWIHEWSFWNRQIDSWLV